MKTILRIYLVLIFASIAIDAGSVNDSINSGLQIEAFNFAKTFSYPQNLQGMADCINYSTQKEYKTIKGVVKESKSEKYASEDMSEVIVN